MPCQNLDATILLETPPTFTFEGGMFYITDKIGGVTIRRCIRPHDFMRSSREAKRVIDEYIAQRDAGVIPFPEQSVG